MSNDDIIIGEIHAALERHPGIPHPGRRSRFVRGAALQALVSNDRVSADRIEATVANGWLTMKGEVKHQSQSDAAFDAVRRLPGIGGITNKIVVITAGIAG